MKKLQDVQKSINVFRITDRQLFSGGKAARKRLFDAPCRWAKRRLHNLVHATRLQLSLGVLTVCHEKTFYRSLRAKLGNPYIAPKGSEQKFKLTLCFNNTLFDNFLRSRFKGSPTHFWPGAKVKIKGLSLMLKQPSAGDLVEASSNLFAIVKTTARKIFTASPLRKKSRDFFSIKEQ